MGENPWDYRPRQKQMFMCPAEFDLTASSGQIAYLPIGYLDQCWGNSTASICAIITRMVLLYTEACDGVGTGSNIRLGHNGSTYGHTTYENQVQSLGDVVEVSQDGIDEPRVFLVNNFIGFTVMGTGSQTTGKVRMGVELSFDITDWKDFTV